jgi:hypothetical protein
MIGPFDVVWSDPATEDWMRLSFADAQAVSVAVRRFAEGSPGPTVVCVDSEYRLFVGVLMVVMLIDGDTLYVDRVRRA